MTTISKFSVYTHCNHLGGKVWNPAIKWTNKHAVFVELEDSDGNTGLGECWCFDSSPESLLAFLRTEVAPHVLNMPLHAHAELSPILLARATLTARHGMLASALSGVDIALWDMRSKIARQPLWKYLRAQGLKSEMPDGCVYMYGSGGLYGEDKTTDDLVTEMRSIQGDGFNTVKMKVGALSMAEDKERVLAVLTGLDDNCKLIIDGVYSYTAKQAREFYESLPNGFITAFQSPVAASDIKAMQDLTKAGVPVMATEAEYRDELHKALVKAKAVKYLQTAPIACGGITRLIELSEIVKGTPVFLSLEVSSTAVALLAASHFAAASQSVAHTEYHYLHQVLFNELDVRPIRGNAGWFQLPGGNGLGLKLPQAELSAQFNLPLN